MALHNHRKKSLNLLIFLTVICQMVTLDFQTLLFVYIVISSTGGAGPSACSGRSIIHDRTLLYPASGMPGKTTALKILFTVFSLVIHLPRTHGKIIHSTMVGGGPCMLRSDLSMCWEASSSRNRKVKYDAVWQINLINGFLMNSPSGLLGAIR